MKNFENIDKHLTRDNANATNVLVMLYNVKMLFFKLLQCFA